MFMKTDIVFKRSINGMAKQITKYEESLACDLYEKGKTITEISASISISRTTTMNILKRNNIKLKGGNKYNKEVTERVKMLYESGATIQCILKETGIKSIQTIYRLIGNQKRRI